MTEPNKIEQTKIDGKKNSNGFNINIIKETIINNKPIRYGLMLYVGCALISCGVFTYLDGKESLLKLRASPNYVKNLESEWKAIKAGCEKTHMFYRISEALFFPISTVSNIVPYIILKIN